MKILTAGNRYFKEMIRFSVKRMKELGYEPIVYNLGGLGFGKPFNIDRFLPQAARGYLAKALWKPTLVKKTLKQYNEPVMWLDGDAIIRKRIDLGEWDFDIAVTMRRQSERGKGRLPDISGYLNAGVIFFNNTGKAKEFIDKWDKLLRQLTPPSDQYALSKLVRETTDLTEYDKVFVSKDGVRIKVLKCDEYNYYYFNEGIPDGVKVIHFKGKRYRGRYNEFKDK